MNNGKEISCELFTGIKEVERNKEINFEVIIYAQKILELLKKNNDSAFTFVEILSRIPNIKDIEKFIDNLEKKDEFDFLVFNKIILFLSENPKFLYKVNINLSPTTLQMPLFRDRFMEILLKHNLVNPGIIHFELTENGDFSEEELKNVNDNILFLKSIGISVGIDDYPNKNNNNELLGKITGIDFIKIDKQPIIDFIDKKINTIELITIIGKYITSIEEKLGENNIKIFIEGVENERVYNLIKYYFKEKITLYQGYYFSKPKRIEEIDY